MNFSRRTWCNSFTLRAVVLDDDLSPEVHAASNGMFLRASSTSVAIDLGCTIIRDKEEGFTKPGRGKNVQLFSAYIKEKENSSSPIRFSSSMIHP
jgi:hypothetical protein